MIPAKTTELQQTQAYKMIYNIIVTQQNLTL